jgi:hypothetical protein
VLLQHHTLQVRITDVLLLLLILLTLHLGGVATRVALAEGGAVGSLVGILLLEEGTALGG